MHGALNVEQKAWIENPLNKTAESIAYYRDQCTIFVIARCLSRNMILLGGLGFAGHGTRWRDERPEHVYYRGYDQARFETPDTIKDDFSVPDSTSLH